MIRVTAARWPALLALALIPGGCNARGAGGGDVAQAETLPPVTAVATTATPARVDDFALDGDLRQGGTAYGRLAPGLRNLTLDGRPIPVAPDGRFMIGFDRDAPNGMQLAAQRADGSRAERFLAVALRSWAVQNIDASPTGSASSAEFQAKRGAELNEINAARRVPVTSDGWRQTFIWPVAGRITANFGVMRNYRGTPGSYHSGTDIGAAAGTPFVAPADGVVVLAANRPFTLEGYLLIVDHGMGLSSAFLHCSKLEVKAGDRVTQGQRLGLVGATGRAKGAHMHWGLKWNDARI
ncbi:MAG: hypothetical protein RLZZ58_3, partial [Pseudomonadota bacterium]